MSVDQILLRILYVCLIVLTVLFIVGFSYNLWQRATGQ